METRLASITETTHNQSKANVLFFDDFRDRELDRSKWNVRITGKTVNNEQQAYVDSGETIYVAPADQIPGATNGALVLHPRYRPGHITPEGAKFDFISGRIDTRDKFDFQYGSAAARIRLPAGAGVWPAFWLLGYGKWPEMGEIDVLEYVGEMDWVSGAAHGPGYFGEAGLVNKRFLPADNDVTNWHIYAVDWTPERLIFTVDDTIYYRITRPMVDFFGPWVFDNRKFIILNFALGGTYPFKTNGIKTPYYGLPASTAQLIREDRVQMAVDWVRVTRNED
jgi:beta-glucanase (GH16 family)